MADTSSPAFDRVGHRPDVMNSLGGASGSDRFSNGPLPAPVHMMDRNGGNVDDKPLERPGPSAEENRFGASAFNRFLPKPVEVMSVPETPTNNSTPAGGTPRPELNLTEEPEPTPPRSRDEPTIDPIPMTGVEESKPIATTSEPMQKSPAPVRVEETRPAEPKPEERRPLFGEPVPPKEPTLHPVPEPSGGETSDFTLNGNSRDVDKLQDKPKDRPEPPVTHTGPESKPVPAPAPAPVVESSRIAPVDTPPSMSPAAEPKATEHVAPVEPAKAAPIKSPLPFEPVKAAPAQTTAPTEPTKATPAQTSAPVKPVKAAPAPFEPARAVPAQTTAPAEPAKPAPALSSAPPEPLKPAAPLVGEKRKADDMAPSAEGDSSSTNLPVGDRSVPDAGSLAKKPKIDEAPAQSNGNEASAPSAAPVADAPPKAPKAPKPKKEKKPPVVGKTARKTRSQGPADA